MTEFLLDENVLGLDRFLDNHVKYKKVGDKGCPNKEAPDQEIVKFAIDNELIIVTKDNKMVSACRFEKTKYITINDETFAQKVIDYKS